MSYFAGTLSTVHFSLVISNWVTIFCKIDSFAGAMDSKAYLRFNCTYCVLWIGALKREKKPWCNWVALSLQVRKTPSIGGFFPGSGWFLLFLWMSDWDTLGLEKCIQGPTLETNLPRVENMTSKELASLLSSQAGQNLGARLLLCGFLFYRITISNHNSAIWPLVAMTIGKDLHFHE